MPHPDEAYLRQMVRELLREVAAERKAIALSESVRIASDSDLQAFIVKLSAPAVIEAVRAGKLRFTLEGENSMSASAPSQPALGGVVSEQKLSGYATGEAITLAADAVLTPLAKDMARRLGLKIARVNR